MRAFSQAQYSSRVYQIGGAPLPFQPSDSSAQRDEVREVQKVVRVAFLGAPLLEEPGEASAKLAYLNKGTALEVIGESGAFLCVRVGDGATGYIRSNTVAIRLSSSDEGD